MIRATQCSLYWVGRGGGRCARGGGRTDRHHVVKRSEDAEKCLACRGAGLIPVLSEVSGTQECPECLGAGVEAKALADICPPCHDAIHDEQLTRVRLPSGAYAYVDGPRKDVQQLWAAIRDSTTDEDATGVMILQHGWRVARFWGDIGDALEGGMDARLQDLAKATGAHNQGAWDLGRVLYGLEIIGDAWQVMDSSFAEMVHETGINPRVSRSYLCAVRMLEESSHITEEQRDKFYLLPISILTGQGLEAVASMTTEQVDVLLEQARILPAFHVVQEAITAAGVAKTKAAGKRHASVTLVAASATLECNVAFGEGQDPVAMAKERIELKNRPGTIAWGASTWEETK